MKKRYFAALLVAVISGWASIAATQEIVKPKVPSTNPTTAPEIVEAIAASAKDPEKELRYEFMSHVFAVNGVPQEIYLKMDSFTGKTWRYHASSGKWQLIADQTGAQAPAADTYSRYELLSHDYFDTYGEDQELMMRVDMVSGKAWTYRGANGVWKEIGQED